MYETKRKFFPEKFVVKKAEVRREPSDYFVAFSEETCAWRIQCGTPGAAFFDRSSEKRAGRIAKAINRRRGAEREDFLNELSATQY